MTLHRTDYYLRQVGHAYPEAYEVFLDDVRIGYLRLRWGVFRIDYEEDSRAQLHYDGRGGIMTTLDEMSPEGFGDFEPHERNHFINLAIVLIDRRHHEGAEPEVEIKEVDPVGWSLVNDKS